MKKNLAYLIITFINFTLYLIFTDDDDDDDDDDEEEEEDDEAHIVNSIASRSTASDNISDTDSGEH